MLRAGWFRDGESSALKDKPTRCGYLFNNGSYYTPGTSCQSLTFDNISKQWSLLGKGDIKNYEDEIGQFFTWLMRMNAMPSSLAIAVTRKTKYRR